MIDLAVLGLYLSSILEVFSNLTGSVTLQIYQKQTKLFSSISFLYFFKGIRKFIQNSAFLTYMYFYLYIYVYIYNLLIRKLGGVATLSSERRAMYNSAVRHRASQEYDTSLKKFELKRNKR